MSCQRGLLDLAVRSHQPGLARLSLSARPLWIMDEPMTALDAAGAALLARIVDGHLAKGGLAVAATHAPLGLSEARLRSLALG